VTKSQLLTKQSSWVWSSTESLPSSRTLSISETKGLNLLKVVADTDWGADCPTLLKLYRSHIRAKRRLWIGSLRIGPRFVSSIVRSSAKRRVCLGACRTSPIPSLHVEANEMPLALRRQKLARQYTIRLKSNPSNPAYSCVFTPCCKALFDARPTVIPTIGIRMQQQLCETGINLDCIARSGICAAPPWLMRTATSHEPIRANDTDGI
jgi:hypothetical protein